MKGVRSGLSRACCRRSRRFRQACHRYGPGYAHSVCPAAFTAGEARRRPLWLSIWSVPGSGISELGSLTASLPPNTQRGGPHLRTAGSSHLVVRRRSFRSCRLVFWKMPIPRAASASIARAAPKNWSLCYGAWESAVLEILPPWLPVMCSLGLVEKVPCFIDGHADWMNARSSLADRLWIWTSECLLHPRWRQSNRLCSALG